MFKNGLPGKRYVMLHWGGRNGGPILFFPANPFLSNWDHINRSLFGLFRKQLLHNNQNKFDLDNTYWVSLFKAFILFIFGIKQTK